jgi:hypothetical protein
MIEGHTPEDVQAGIRLYAQSLPHANAVLCALRDARKFYRMEFPRGAFPAHLRKKRKPKKPNKWVEEIL